MGLRIDKLVLGVFSRSDHRSKQVAAIWGLRGAQNSVYNTKTDLSLSIYSMCMLLSSCLACDRPYLISSTSLCCWNK